MKRVAFLANTAWYLKNFRTNTIKAFVCAGFEVVLIYPEGSGVPPKVTGVECHAFPLNNTGTNPLQESISLFSLWRYIRHVKPDFLFTFNPKTNLYGLLVSRWLGLHCVPNISGVGNASELEGWKGITYRRMMSWAYKHAHHLFFQNQEDMQHFVDLGLAKTDAYERIPGSGVDLDRFQVLETDQNAKEQVTFLLACRLIRPKGVEVFMQAAERLRERYGERVQFLLAGVADHSNRAVPLSLIKQYEASGAIRFLGEVDEMPAILTKASVVVLPSWYPEGVPRILLEGLATGKVIITTDRPGCRDTVEEPTNGFFVVPEALDSLEAAMERVVTIGPEARQAMGHYSRRIAEEHFDERRVIARYLDVVQKSFGQYIFLSTATKLKTPSARL